MQQRSMLTFSLASMNTHGVPFPSREVVERYVAICQGFERTSADILTMQEVWSYRLLRTLKATLPSYPYMAYTPGTFGPRAGLVTCSRSPLAARSVRSIDIPPVAEPRKRKWINRMKRSLKKKGVLLATLADMPLTICNVHLVANGDGDWSEDGRYYCAHTHDITTLSNLIHTFKGNTLLVSGDFNIPKSSDLYNAFLDLSNATDLFAHDESPTYHNEFLTADQRSHRIDYIFVYSCSAPSIQQKALLFDEKVMLSNGNLAYLSDHCGLFVEATL